MVDKDGKPISGADVRQGQDRWGSEYPHTRSDKEGRFSFPNAKKGNITLTVQKKGFSPELITLNVHKGIEPVRIVLEKGANDSRESRRRTRQGPGRGACRS